MSTASKITINADIERDKIDSQIYGHFSEHLGRCIYDGYWVGEGSKIPNVRGIRTDIVEALKKIKTPNIRWPGGCFADTYHWKDGIGPKEQRPSIINIHWGGVSENNHFGTHEFMDLCEQIECEPYVCSNVGSGTVQEMYEWLDYINNESGSPMSELRQKNGRHKPWKLKYWGIGNENWGCGGGMTPEYYADVYRRFATYARSFTEDKLYRVACGPNGSNYEWTDVLMSRAAGRMEGLALHYYSGLKREEGMSRSATEFGEKEWFRCLQRALGMDELVRNHSTIMDKYDPEKRVALIVDEWGTWYAVEPGTNPGFLYQQNSMRDALVAALSLNIFNAHCDRVRMANIAQTINVLQAMILTDGEQLLLTPSYHVYEMYTVHHGASLLSYDFQCGTYDFEGESIPAISASASKDADGKVHISLANLDPSNGSEFTCEVRGMNASNVSGRILTSDEITAHNTFDRPDLVGPAPFSGAKINNGMISATLPAKSVVVLEIT